MGDRFAARVADQVLDRLVAAFDLIAANPGAGHRRDDLTRAEDIRFWSVGPTLIAYRVRPGSPIEVLFVECGEKAWDPGLEEA